MWQRQVWQLPVGQRPVQQERPVWQRPVVTTIPLAETLATAGSNSDGGTPSP